MKDANSAPFNFVLTERVRVLVVDDDPILRTFASVYLSAPNTTVETAENAEEGLSMLAENGYDIVLADIDMPGMGGIAMLRAIRSTPRFAHIPIIMVTGSEDIISIDNAYEAGATSFVTKPVNWRVMTYHLRFVLRTRDRRGHDGERSEYGRAATYEGPERRNRIFAGLREPRE